MMPLSAKTHAIILALTTVLAAGSLGLLIRRVARDETPVMLTIAPGGEIPPSSSGDANASAAGRATPVLYRVTQGPSEAEKLQATLSQGIQQGAGSTAIAESDRRKDQKRSALAEVPRARRWQFFLQEGLKFAEYAQQLEALQIELGFVLPDGTIHYARLLTNPMPETRQGKASEETRLYYSWARGDMEQSDRRLLALAGIDVTGQGEIVHYLPDELVRTLEGLEKGVAQRAPNAILRTRFGIRPAGNSFEPYVIHQIPIR